MGRLIVAVLVVALAWMGFWVFAQVSLTRAIEAYLAGPQEGVEVTAGEVSVAGFPNRLDTTLSDVTVTLPETRTTWQAPFAQLLALVYRPTELIAALPPAHRLTTPGQEIAIENDRARASVALQALSDMALDRATLVIETGRATSSLGWQAGVDELRLSVVETETALYRLGASVSDLTTTALPPALPPVIETIHLDATALFSAPWDRSAVNRRPLPQITRLRLDDLSMTWGEIGLVAKGEVEVDDRGRPEGRLDLTLDNWRAALDAFERMGVFGDGLPPIAEFALGALADGDRLTVPLAFSGGLTRLGPLPIGPAPDLTIR